MENYVLALGIRGLKAYGETWTRGYRGIKPDEVPQRNLLREKFYAEVQPFAEQMKKKTPRCGSDDTLYALAVQNRMQENLRSGGSSLKSGGRRHLQKNTARFTVLSWSFWIRLSRCWARKNDTGRVSGDSGGGLCRGFCWHYSADRGPGTDR